MSNPTLACLCINFYCSVSHIIQPVCQPIMRRAAHECPMRTSLDLELDLQASRTRQNRLNDELQALRDLKQKLEEMKGRGETDLPLCVLEDERFQKLLKQAEKQVWAAQSCCVNNCTYAPTFSINSLKNSIYCVKDFYGSSHLTNYTPKLHSVNTISLSVNPTAVKPRIWGSVFLVPSKYFSNSEWKLYDLE